MVLMQKKNRQYRVFGEVYNVANYQKRQFGESLTDDEDWFEYRVFLENPDGEIVDMWDSIHETYNGVKGQRLTKESAKDAVNEIKRDINVKEENPELWFSNID